MQRQPAVAGRFYPNNPKELKQTVTSFLDQAKLSEGNPPKAIISPHAGYIYSGQTAGAAYKQLINLPKKHYNIFLIGASHNFAIDCSVGNFENYQTPLGEVKVNQEICEKLIEEPSVSFIPQTHVPEHSLEVQLPFLQTVFGHSKQSEEPFHTKQNDGILKQVQDDTTDFSIIPILTGFISPDVLADILNPYFTQNNSVFVVSSDLSHYKTYDEAIQADTKSLKIITDLDFENEDQIDACGKVPIQTIMRLAKKNNLKVNQLEYKNSGDTAGDKSRVVGYSALEII